MFANTFVLYAFNAYLRGGNAVRVFFCRSVNFLRVSSTA
jgi:hypothetical protein